MHSHPPWIQILPSVGLISSTTSYIYLLESAALEAITGLTTTEANYEEAVATLKKRFGNPQLIINRHMEALLNVSGVSSYNDIRDLRRLRLSGSPYQKTEGLEGPSSDLWRLANLHPCQQTAS